MKTGLLDESLIDAAVARILALKFRLGLFEDPRLPDQERINAVIGSEDTSSSISKWLAKPWHC